MSVVKYETHKCTVCARTEALNLRAGGTCSNNYEFKD